MRCFASVAEQQAFFAGLPAFPVGAREDAAFIRAFDDFDRRGHGEPFLDSEHK